MRDPRTQLVADAYDAIGETFAEWRTRILDDPREEWEAEFTSRLPEGARVLELGAGAGTVETRRLAARYRYTGVDISPQQVERARAAIPGAEFVCADFMELGLAPGSFDGVISFYVLNHVPRELLAPLLGRMHEWLAPGGWFANAFATHDNAGWRGEWLGAETFFAGYEPEVNSRLVREAGFRIERDELVTFQEPEGPATFQWILAER